MEKGSQKQGQLRQIRSAASFRLSLKLPWRLSRPFARPVATSGLRASAYT